MQTIYQRLAKASRDNWSTHLKDIIPKLYQVFTKESFDQLPDWKQWDHTIELVPDAQKFSTKVYLLTPVEQKQLDKFLNDNLKSGCMCTSKSLMASLFFIKKKDANLCLIQDYQKLNSMTMKNTYPLLFIPDILNKVSEAKAKYFTELEIHWGYNNVWIKEGEEGILLDEPRLV